jgi:hypothetical protein
MSDGGGAICNGGEAFETRRIHFCPTEGRLRRFYVRYQHYYGAEWYCLGCGDRWCDDERGERPFMRGWRADAIKHAKKGWDGVTVKASERNAAFRAFMEAFVAEMESAR